MRVTISFICKRCADNADSGNLIHGDCGTDCDCQHGKPRIKRSVTH